MKLVLLFYSALLFFVSCNQENIPQVERKDFSLEIGMLEDQIALFNLDGKGNTPTAAIAMRDGLFYISSGSGGKISKYTSYGDLIFMIYNEESNPPPLTLRANAGENEVITRWAVAWPLLEPGRITVDSRKHIYVEDKLPYERRAFDTERQTLLDSMILHFDDSGRFIEYLGQEGVGGSPFPRISGIYSSANDELVVVCRLPDGWMIYWFDAEASALFLIPFNNSAVPIPPDRLDVFPSVDAIMAAPDRRQLFIKVDYYRAVNDESTGTRSGVEPDSSVVWILDAETGIYIDTIEVPFYERAAGSNRRETEKLFYSMLGVIREGRVFLSFPVEEGYSVLILQTDSKNPGGQSGGRLQGLVRVEAEELEFNCFNLSAEGILSGLLATEHEARLVWWRTDRLAVGLLP